MNPVLPNFMILGAQKCGTTSLAAALRSHPDIFIPARKEFHHFGRVPDDEAGGAEYTQCFSAWDGEAMIGEATPDYLHLPTAPSQIVCTLPEVRGIAVLRNPVDRAYSGYWHGIRSGLLTGSFEQALEAEPESLKAGRSGFAALTSKGRYAEQLIRYHDAGLDSTRLHVAFFEELTADPRHQLAAIQGFLDVDPVVHELPRANVAARSRLPRRIRRAVFVRRRESRLARTVLNASNSSFTPPPMKPATRQRLVDYFRPLNADLSNLLGRDLPGWDQ